MADSNVQGIKGEYRRLTTAEVGLMIRMFREGQSIKRAALAADANMSEKTLERAESGQGISEEYSRRIARALGLRADAFVAELYVPAPGEAEQMFKRQDEELRATHRPQAVAELSGIRDVLPLIRSHVLFADDQNVAESDLEDFASLKQSWWDWNAISGDISEPEFIRGAQSFLDEIRSFEAHGYVVKSGTGTRYHRDGGALAVAILVAFIKPKGAAGTPNEVWLPKRMSMGFRT